MRAHIQDPMPLEKPDSARASLLSRARQAFAGVEQGALHVTVADTGIGIKAEQIGLLFEAFRQVDGSAKRTYEGTGLGLYLCRKLLGLMGGEITVESVYGEGSRFMYTMPVELTAESPSAYQP